MSELLLKGHLHNHKTTTVEDEEVRNIARVRTLTVLPRLDGVRKRSVIQFLYESDLIGNNANPDGIINLKGADLRAARLDEVDLNGASLQAVDLRSADLNGAQLRGADLSGVTKLNNAILRGADLTLANLSDADLSNADLTDANLNATTIVGATYTRIQLDKAKLKGSKCIQ